MFKIYFILLMEASKDLICLTNKDTRVKVSSSLKGSPENTKDKLFDGKVDTSWYSNSGKFQYIYVYFDEPVNIKEINFIFDEGFAPKEIEMSISQTDEYDNKKPVLTQIKTFDVSKSNGTDKLTLNEEEMKKCLSVKTVKFLMKKFNDPFGRIIVYDLKIKGTK